MRSRCGRRAFRASPIRCVGERIMATGVPEFREVAWRACLGMNEPTKDDALLTGHVPYFHCSVGEYVQRVVGL
ncbi:hypothetical protein [Bathymodiolus japonicus methanotrophic gill symbiont]|uniref:hypothetical protein n=1 Tax=Bathymodiolus japonicus methanotrophic gill symbiont TaxID=113269 RepID=UPI001C8D7A05|nr:hypothetical protein [Bathymodiolus japonicus methanotrophic gill symbiont]